MTSSSSILLHIFALFIFMESPWTSWKFASSKNSLLYKFFWPYIRCNSTLMNLIEFIRDYFQPVHAFNTPYFHLCGGLTSILNTSALAAILNRFIWQEIPYNAVMFCITFTFANYASADGISTQQKRNLSALSRSSLFTCRVWDKLETDVLRSYTVKINSS